MLFSPKMPVKNEGVKFGLPEMALKMKAYTAGEEPASWEGFCITT